MSRESRHSLNRSLQKQNRSSCSPSSYYITETSTDRPGISLYSSANPRHTPTAPNKYVRNYGGDNESKSIECLPIDDDIELLEDFEAPNFHDLPPDSSFDEVRCTMATPPRAAPTSAEKLNELRTEIADVIKMDDLRRRIAAHMDPSEVDSQDLTVQVDDVRKRITSVIEESASKPPFCAYKIPPLPENPEAIPPPPKDPKDIVAIVRRARAIARLKALEEERAGLVQPKDKIKKGVRSLAVPRHVATLKKSKAGVSKLLKQVPTSPKLKPLQATKKQIPSLQKPKLLPATRKNQQCPAENVPENWAADILRARKLAGLKTSNAKLLPKPKAHPVPPVVKPKSPSRQPSPPPKLPTFENIMERVSAIRSKTNIAKAVLDERQKDIIAQRPQDESEELEEFEALEELYGATRSDQCPPTQQNVVDLQSRINFLQQQLLKSPVPADPMVEELEEFEALERQCGLVPSSKYPTRKNFASNLQDRINILKENIFQSPAREQEPIYELPSILRYENLFQNRDAMAAADAEIGLMQKNQVCPSSKYISQIKERTPTRYPSRRSISPTAATQTRSQKFDDAILQNIEMPEFDVNEIPEFAFSVETLAEAGFEIGDDDSLGRVSMPDFDEDISFNEVCLADITSPDLCDLSISGDNLALEPDFPIEISTEEEETDHVTEKIVTEEIPEQPGLLTSVVSAIVDRLKNMFSSKAEDVQNLEEVSELELDTSLPNMFEITPPTKSGTPKNPRTRTNAETPVVQQTVTKKAPIVIPPHPKDPKNYMAMIKRAQAIQKRKMEELAADEVCAPFCIEKKKNKKEIMSSIPKPAPPPKKKVPMLKKRKSDKPAKVYPPGEYSPSYVKAVARARSLAGLRNLSAVLNPERAAKIEERKAAIEANLAAIEAMPPVERMREKMRIMHRDKGGVPRPTIEALATLEAIRESLPRSEALPQKRKWRPAGRLRVDRRVKPSERLFWRDFGRVLIPTEKTQKKKNWKELAVMSPILEESDLKNDFIQFSPLKPHEGRIRLDYLKEAARKAEEALQAAEEKQAEIETSISCPSASPITQTTSSMRLSPIRLHSPSSPRTEETRREKIITKLGPHGGSETIREEVAETSTVENGKVHTSTRQVTTNTDEYGNVTYHVQERQGLSGEGEAIPEDLADIEPPDFLDLSDIPPPRDPSIPTPNEIINRIRPKVKEKLSHVPNNQNFSKSFSISPRTIDLPQNLPDEDLFDIETPVFERTPPKDSPREKKVWSIEKDEKMYAWGEHPPSTPPQRVPTPKVSPLPLESVKHLSPISKTKSPEAIVCIPPHPKDPKNYRAMIKRAQAIQKLKKQQESLAADPSKQPLPGTGRVPISKWEKQPLKVLKRNRLVLKKQIPRISPRKIEQQKVHDDMECPTEPLPLPQKYREAVARARLLHGLKNKTAALNPAIAEKIAQRKATEEAARAAYNALSEVEKIKIKLEKLRKDPSKKHRIEPSAELLGTLAAIRANIPPESKLSPHFKCPIPEKYPVSVQSSSPQAPRTHSRAARPSPADSSRDEFEKQQTGLMPFSQQYVSSQEQRSVPNNFEDISLEEFENLEAQLKSGSSLEEFEALEAEAKKLYDFDTPKRSERHGQRLLLREFPTSHSPESQHPHFVSPTPSTALLAPSMRLLAQAQFFQDIIMPDDSILKSITRPQTISRPDTLLGTVYDDPMLDFRVPAEDIDLETSQLMLETPNRNIQERFQRLKDAQEKSTLPTEHTEQYLASPTTTEVVYSPIQLISPRVSGERERLSSPILTPAENNCIFNLDEIPERVTRPVRQLRDLEDMPFDDLEYEIEPTLTDISLEKPLSPPPRPSDIISRIKSKLKMVTQCSPLLSPEILKLPEELPDEELLELSAPSFTQTPPSTPPKKYKSPRVSLPMAWGEPEPASSTTPDNLTDRIPTPIKKQSPVQLQEVVEKNISTPDGLIVIPPHPKDPRDYGAMIRRARAIYKLNKQREAEKAALAPPPTETQKKDRVPISRWQRLPPKLSAKPKRKVLLRKRVEGEEEERVCPTEPPPLAQDYRDEVAKARLLHGLKNRTAALNPKIAARVAAKKAAQEAALAAYNALPEIEKIKVRMEKLRKKPKRMRHIKPTMEHIAYLEALKQINEYQTSSPEPLSKGPTSLSLSEPRVLSRPESITPRADLRQIWDAESLALAELAEFEALEQFDKAASSYPTSTQDFDLKQRIAELRPLLEAEDISQIHDVSLAEFEALEAMEAPPIKQDIQPVVPLNLNQLIADLRQKQLATPPRIDPKERFRELIAQRKVPPTPVASPVITPEVRYTPITLLSSPAEEERKKLAQRTTTQITRSGDNVIEEQVVETSEIVDGKLQHFRNLLSTTTDPQGNVTCQINESKRVSARDRSAEMKPEDLEEIQEPSYLDITPPTPIEQPRPRDIIERVRRQVKERYKPEVPTGRLVELRTPPRMLPLPTEVPDEELLDLSCPRLERTPESPVRSPPRSLREADISIPQLFQPSPSPLTPPISPVSPLRYRVQSPESPLVIPTHPKDPKDYRAMVRRARKIQQFIKQNEAEKQAQNVAEAAPKNKGRVPISRWTAPPPKKPGKRKKLDSKKRDEAVLTKSPVRSTEECPMEPKPLPEHFAKEVALARKLAGLKNRTAALNPKVAARAAAKAEAIRRAEEAEAARISTLNAPPRSPMKNYAEVLSRVKELKEKGALVRGEPSLAAAAYLNALKGAMCVRQDQEQIASESPKSRFERILAERTNVPSAFEESSFTTPLADILYSPIRFVSPRIGEAQTDLAETIKQHELNLAALHGIDELDDLSEIEQPSYMNVSQYQYQDQYLPLTPPQTPPPAPSVIINRIRQQYEQKNNTTAQERSLPTPVSLEFPEELPEEQLFELSAPSFVETPLKSQTPVMSPNISIPQYFEESPFAVHKSISPKRSISPTAAVIAENVNEERHTLPGIKVKTPQGKITVPPHPKDPKDVAAIVRRAQIIQKLLERESADKTTTKGRVPVSRKVPFKLVPQKKRKLKKEPRSVTTRSAVEYPTEPPELPAEYLEAVAKARKLAGLKSVTSTDLGPKSPVKETTLVSKRDTTGSTKVTPPPSSYATIMEKVAALKAKRKMQQAPTSRELTQRQHFINRQQRQERKRHLNELERLRQQQVLEFKPLKTPTPARDRLKAIKLKIAEQTTSSECPYSPVKTPEVVDFPQFQPLALPQTPPYPFLQNVSIADIADESMLFDELDNYTLDYGTTDEEDLEFQLAEIANSAYEFGENVDVAELDRGEAHFNIAERIQMLQQQLLESQDRIDADILEEYNLTKRMEILKNQLLRTPTQEESPTEESTKDVCVEVPLFYEEEDEEVNHQDFYDDFMDDFEAMERECL